MQIVILPQNCCCTHARNRHEPLGNMSNFQITLSRVRDYRCSQQSPAPNAWMSWLIATESQVIELLTESAT